MAPCKFKSSWLNEKDANGDVISSWAKECDFKHIICKVCEKKVPVAGGIYAVKQHAQGKKHQSCVKNKFGAGQLHLQVVTSEGEKEVILIIIAMFTFYKF